MIVKDRDAAQPIGGIYKIPIKVGHDEVYYIGETKRDLKIRLSEHKYSLHSPYGNTSFKEFVLDKKAIPLWDQTKIIASPTNLKHLHWREAIEIFLQHNSINLDSGRIINPIWHPLLRELI